MGVLTDPSRLATVCAMFKSGVPVPRIADEFGVQGPAVWKALRRAGVMPPYGKSHVGGPGRPAGGGKPGYTAERLRKQASAIHARECRRPSVPDQRVQRDPCFKCGVRGDVGCKHREA